MALFFRKREDWALGRLRRGFHALHADVEDDFRKADPKDDAALLDWYRKTEAYIWELSAYHADAGFNYAGMTRGISERLRAAGAKSVLILGDGIGDMSMQFEKDGFQAYYHDLAGSRTAEFAHFRWWMYGVRPGWMLTTGWRPEIKGQYHAIVSADFLEHVTDVPAWTAAIKQALVPGGYFFCQNAFGIGSGPSGPMPMHLERNDRFVSEWDPLLASLDFRQESSNWYRRAA